MDDQKGPTRKAFVEKDPRGRIRVVVEEFRFYATALGAVAVAVTIMMGVSAYLLRPYLTTVAQSAMASEMESLDQRFSRFVTKETFQEHRHDAEDRASLLASSINQTTRILDTIERRIEIHGRRLDRLYERQWDSRRSALVGEVSLAPWPPPGVGRPPGWEMRSAPR